MIDTHVHFTYISKKTKELEDVFKRANKEGIYYFVDIGLHPDDINERMYILSNAEKVFFSAGYYPDYSNENSEDTINAFELKVKNLNGDYKLGKKRICAIGEIGLDYYHNSENRYEQIEFFLDLCNVAKRLSLPIIIHSRDAFKDTFKILKKVSLPKTGIFHCFSGGLEEAKEALDLGYILSFSGNVTYLKNNFIRDVVKYVPDNMFTIETDSPYLSPHKVSGRSNEPAFITYTAELIANIKNKSKQEIMCKTLENANRILELNINLLSH